MPENTLTEDRRKEIFLALVEAQDQAMSVPQSRKKVAEQFAVTVALEHVVGGVVDRDAVGQVVDLPGDLGAMADEVVVEPPDDRVNVVVRPGGGARE